jgi:PAS domain S-box-containing protein
VARAEHEQPIANEQQVSFDALPPSVYGEREQVEEELKRSQARLESAQAQAKIGSWELGPNLEPRYWSKQMYVLFGHNPEVGLPELEQYLERIHPDDRVRLPEVCQEAVEQRQQRRMTFRGYGTLGENRYFEVTFVPEYDEDGRLLKVKGTTQDVSERVLSEEALRMSEARLEAAQAQAKIGSWEYNPATREAFYSKEMYRLLEREPMSAVAGHDNGQLMSHLTEWPRIVEALRRVIDGNQQVSLEICGLERPDGTQKYFEITMVPVRDPKGNLLQVTGTLQDVTERRQAAEALRLSELRLQRLLENSNDLIAVLDAEGRQWSIRGPLKAMLGYEPAELEGTNAFELMHPDDIPIAQRVIAESFSHPGVPCRAEYRYRHKDNSWVDMEAVGTNWLNDPIIQGTIINLRQITERKRSEAERVRLQEQLLQAIKMEAVGRLAGGVAHDFNNLLTVITGNVELALAELEPHDPLTQSLIDVGKAASSAASLTRQLLAFSRRQIVEPKVVNLNDLIGNLEKMLGRLIGEDITLELRLASALGSVRLDPGQFDQVIVNLTVNARDSMPKGGRLTIATENIELDESYCRTHRDLNPGLYVSLVVTDTGEGMSGEVLNRIFEPFFTTKPQGLGTGLGLSVTFGVVKQAGGTIETYSELGSGTTFKIFLPRVDEPAQKFDKTKNAREVPRGTETILLVEDNDSVRELTTTMLRRLGYHLLVATNGARALELIKNERPAIALLLTDLIMPEMSGRELSDRVRELYPDIAVLYCSGYTEDTFVRLGLVSENLQFIGKPFSLQNLGTKVRQVLDERLPRK